MTEFEQQLRQQLAKRVRRVMYVLVHFIVTAAVVAYALNNNFCCGPAAQADDYLAAFLIFTLMLHIIPLVGRFLWERYVRWSLRRVSQQPEFQTELQTLVEREVTRRLAEYGIYDEKAKHSPEMQLSHDGEWVPLVESENEQYYQKR